MAAAGNDLHSDYRIKFYGFIYMFDDMDNNLWKLASDSTGGRLLGIDALSFSPCSTKIAVNSGNDGPKRGQKRDPVGAAGLPRPRPCFGPLAP